MGKRGVGIVMFECRVLCGETKAGRGNGRESFRQCWSELIISVIGEEELLCGSVHCSAAVEK